MHPRANGDYAQPTSGRSRCVCRPLYDKWGTVLPLRKDVIAAQSLCSQGRIEYHVPSKWGTVLPQCVYDASTLSPMRRGHAECLFPFTCQKPRKWGTELPHCDDDATTRSPSSQGRAECLLLYTWGTVISLSTTLSRHRQDSAENISFNICYSILQYTPVKVVEPYYLWNRPRTRKPRGPGVTEACRLAPSTQKRAPLTEHPDIQAISAEIPHLPTYTVTRIWPVTTPPSTQKRAPLTEHPDIQAISAEIPHLPTYTVTRIWPVTTPRYSGLAYRVSAYLDDGSYAIIRVLNALEMFKNDMIYEPRIVSCIVLYTSYSHNVYNLKIRISCTIPNPLDMSLLYCFSVMLCVPLLGVTHFIRFCTSNVCLNDTKWEDNLHIPIPPQLKVGVGKLGFLSQIVIRCALCDNLTLCYRNLCLSCVSSSNMSMIYRLNDENAQEYVILPNYSININPLRQMALGCFLNQLPQTIAVVICYLLSVFIDYISHVYFYFYCMLRPVGCESTFDIIWCCAARPIRCLETCTGELSKCELYAIYARSHIWKTSVVKSTNNLQPRHLGRRLYEDPCGGGDITRIWVWYYISEVFKRLLSVSIKILAGLSHTQFCSKHNISVLPPPHRHHDRTGLILSIPSYKYAENIVLDRFSLCIVYKKVILFYYLCLEAKI